MNQSLPIEDIPILEQISVEAQREKTQLNSISLLHPWWGRLTHVVARAAVYTALTQESNPDESFINGLCADPTAPDAIREAQQRILSQETTEGSENDIVSRPKVLDLFGGGGTMPLEALRLGCETFALDLNPVAYLLQLCTLYYPQQFGEPTAKERGSAPDRTWAGLAKEVQIWSHWVHEQVKTELSDLYLVISRPTKSKRSEQTLIPIVYLRGRTVHCLNTACNATIPLVRQVWLVKQQGRCIALRPELETVWRQISYSVVESDTPQGLGFDPKPSISRNGVFCPFCNTHLTLKDIRREAETGRMGSVLLAAVCRDQDQQRIYLSGESIATTLPDDAAVQQRIPSDYQGSCEERLKEYIADCDDPRALLKEFLGVGQILIVAREFEPEVDNPDVAQDEILRHFGFTVPVPPQDGPTAAITQIEQLVFRLQSARDKVDLRGIFMTSVNRLESTLRHAAWAWGHIIFGENRDDHLRQIVNLHQNVEKCLDRLAMGDVKRLFCELPDYVVKSSFAESTYNRFGRPHVYKPKRYMKNLDQAIALRNKVEHNKNDYNDLTSVHDMKLEFSDGLGLICKTLRELRDSGALPLVVRPIRETTDMYGRCRVEFQTEDGTTKEIYVTAPIELGRDYLYFRVENNPRPVDPPMLLFSDVFDSKNQHE